MKKLSVWIGLLVLLVFPITIRASLAEVSSPMQQAFSLLYLCDSHGRYQPISVEPGNASSQTGDPGGPPQEYPRAGRIGGMAALATAIKQIRLEQGSENVILLHAGDAFSDDLLGNLTQGEAMIRLMNAVGFQFMALGNHDFDYGKRRTEKLQSIAEFPMRAANVLEASSQQPFLGEPFRIFEIGETPIGVLALGYHNTDRTGNPKNVEELHFTSGIEAARRYIPQIREKVSLVVVLSHQGTEVDEQLARQVAGIDLIIGGHSHDWIQPLKKVNQTWITQSFADTSVLGEVRVTMNGNQISNMQGKQHLLWNDEYPPDPLLSQQIDQLRRPFLAKLTEPVVTVNERIGRHYLSESPFDQLTGKILRRHTRTEVALLPGVGYGVSLSKGLITREELYTLLPHSSSIVTLTMTGDQIRAVLERCGANLAPEHPQGKVGGLLQTSGLRWTLDLTQPLGQRARDVQVEDNPIDLRKSYSVVTHNGMLAGIHNYTVIAEGRDIQISQDKVTDAVEAELRKLRSVNPPPLGNVRVISNHQ